MFCVLQQQSNGVEYGDFVLAFYLHILSEKLNPDGIFFNESKFRHNLLHCLRADLNSPFPKSTGRAI